MTTLDNDPGHNDGNPMSTRTRAVTTAMFLGLGLMLGCAKGTYLEVKFTGSSLLEIHAIRMDLTLMPPNGAAVQHSSDTIKSETALKLPTSMALKLDSESGSLQVDGTLLGVGDVPLGTASATTPIKHDETWTIELRFP